MNTDKSHLLASKTPSRTQGEWLTRFFYVLALRIKPAVWNEVVWIMEIGRIVCYGPGASIALGLAAEVSGGSQRCKIGLGRRLRLRGPNVHPPLPQVTFLGILALLEDISSIPR